MTERVTRAVCAICAVALLAAGCAAPTTGLRGTPETGVVLEYAVPEDTPLRYHLTSEMSQAMEIPGKPVQMETVQHTLISVTPEETEDDLLLTVKIDSMSLLVTAGDQQIAADVADVAGRSFAMNLSRLGEESGFPPADEIQYDMGEAGKRSALTALQMIFPDFADRAVAVGDTWVATDGFTEEAEGGTVEISVTTRNTLEGFEEFLGLPCARISSLYTGTSKGGGTQGPAEWTSEGIIEGVSTAYFAYEDGVFVSESTNGKGTSTISAVGPDGETVLIPVTQTMSFETRLVR